MSWAAIAERSDEVVVHLSTRRLTAKQNTKQLSKAGRVSGDDGFERKTHLQYPLELASPCPG